MSAFQLPGPTKVFRPRLLVHARHGGENVMFGEVVVVTPAKVVAPQPFAQLL
jgi:hypothetical protein